MVINYDNCYAGARTVVTCRSTALDLVCGAVELFQRVRKLQSFSLFYSTMEPNSDVYDEQFITPVQESKLYMPMFPHYAKSMYHLLHQLSRNLIRMNLKPMLQVGTYIAYKIAIFD